MRYKSLFLAVYTLFCVSAGFSQQTRNKDVQELDVTNFSKGLDSFHDSTVLPDGFVQDALNVYFDRQAPVEKRRGFSTAFSSSAYAGQTLWNYTDPNNTEWIIIRDSDVILANNLTGTSSVIIATVTTSNLVGEVNAQGSAYFVDQTQGVYYWNGTKTTYVSGSPLGSLISQFHGRVWVSGLAVPNGNLVYGSKYLDGTIWATGLNPNDPVILTVGLQDNFDSITSLYVFLDTMYTFKHYSTYSIQGYDQTNFQLLYITQECGCIDQQSIQTFNHGLIFVSERGVEFFDGYTCTRISDPVKNLMDNAVVSQGGSHTQSFLVSQTNDWLAGTFTSPALTNLSTSFKNQALSYKGILKSTTSADFNNNGTFFAITYGPQLPLNVSGLQLKIDAANVTNHSFETNDFTGWTPPSNTTIASILQGLHCIGTGPQNGSYFARYATDSGANNINLNAALLHCGTNAILGQVDITAAYTGSCTWLPYTIPESNNANNCAYIKLQDTTNSQIVLVSSNFYTDAQDITVNILADAFAGGGGGVVIGMDNFVNGRNDFASGLYTQFATVYQTTTSFVPIVNWTLPTAAASSPTFLLYGSTSGFSTQSLITTSTGIVVVTTYPAVAYYLNWIDHNSTDAQDIGAYVTSVDLQPSSFTATWTSVAHNISTATAFGNLSVTQDLSGGGTIAYSVCSASNQNFVGQQCAATLPNTQITVSTNIWVHLIATFTVVSTTNTPILTNAAINWFSGSRSTSMASTVWDNRYWLSLTTNTFDTANDAVLVLSQEKAWTRFDLHAGGFTQYKNSLYHSDSLGTGNVYLDDQGYNDNGLPIYAYVRTRDFNLGSQVVDTLFDSFWPSLTNLGNYNVSFTYALDKGGTDYPLATLTQTEFASKKLARIMFPMSSGNPGIAQTVNFKVSANDLGEPLQLQGFSLLYHERAIQE